jgi:hypothetical protein
MRYLTILRVLIYCCVAIPAGAQTTFANARTEALPTVFVTEASGAQLEGQLIGLTESAIVIKTGTLTKTFTPADVKIIERKGDSLKNGALTGLAIGAIGAGFYARSCMHYGHCTAAVVPVMLIGTGLYTAIGTAIDAAIPGRTRIWPGRAR